MMNYNDGEKHFRMNDFTKVRLILVHLCHYTYYPCKIDDVNMPKAGTFVIVHQYFSKMLIEKLQKIDIDIFLGLHINKT